jgi:DNA-binding IclR family transcriptional regulator
MAILGCFSADHAEITTGDIARALDTSPQLLRWHLAALRRAGYLVPGKGRRNKIGLRVLDLGMSTQCGLGVERLSVPYLRELQERTGLTAVLALIDGHHAVVTSCFYRRGSQRGAPDRQIRQEQRLALNCTVIGKTILAYLPDLVARELLAQVSEEHTPNSVTDPQLLQTTLQQIRRNGFGYEREEYRKGLYAIAAPVRGDHAEVIGAVSLASVREFDTADQKVSETLLATASLLSAHLGFRCNG